MGHGDVHPGANGRGHGLLNEADLPHARGGDGLYHGALFHLGDVQGTLTTTRGMNTRLELICFK